jgi:hypothetical protein
MYPLQRKEWSISISYWDGNYEIKVYDYVKLEDFMTDRERLIRTLKFQSVDRVPDFEFGMWAQTLDRWHKEGLPEIYKDSWQAIPEYFKTEDRESFNIEIDVGLFPAFEYKILEEKGDHLIIQDSDGAICEMLKPELGASIPRFLRYYIEDRKDWERLRDERLNPLEPGRIHPDIDRICKATWESDKPVKVWLGSLYGWLRNWMGVENLSYAIYDDPEWVEEMMEHLTMLTLTVLSKVAGKAKVDLGVWWEDMCFKTGSLLSPKHFSQWMVPRYKRITDFVKNECGCEFHRLDCDGNINELVPLWLEGGINVMFPLEAAHTDAYRISREFGSKVPLVGYFDKRALIEGKEAIDREFDRLTPLFKKGGFIPHTDHLVPPDVSFENYLYYRKKKCEFIGKEL